MAYQLYRTNVALTGNVKLGCYITGGKIDHCVLNPLSSRLPISPFNINITGSKYGADLVKFYKKHTLDFYAPDIDPLVTEAGDFKPYTDNDKFFNPCPGDGQYGLKRVSYQKNDKQLSLFAPVFIDSENDIPAYVRFTTKSAGDNNAIYTRTVKITGTALGDYLKRSLENLNGGSDYPHIINTDISASYSIVRGLSMLSGGMLNVKSDLLSRVLDHDMTYREFNAYICDEFQRYNLICPWIINFCWYFDIDDILASRSINAVSDFDNLIINCEYLDKDKNKISFGDLDFNDYNISGRVLSRLNDPKTSTQLNDRESMIQPTANSWSIGSTDYIFNTYLGFDALDENGVPTDKITPDIPYNIDYYAKTVIAGAQNLDWMHIIDTYRAQTITATMDFSLVKFVNDLKAVYYGDYLKRYTITNGDDCFCNGCKFNATGFFDTIKSALGESTVFADNYKLSLSLLNNSVDTNLAPLNFILLTYDDTNTKITAVDFVLFNPHKENYTGQYVSALNDYVAACLNKSIERKNPSYDAIFLKTASSKYVTWYVLDNNEWVDISDTLGDPRIPIYFGKGGLGVEVPKGFYTNNMLTSKDDSNGIYTLYQTGSQIHINRYFGWIQPHIETDTTKIYTFAKHYLKTDPWWMDGDGNKRQWGDGIDVIPFSEVKTYYPQVYAGRVDSVTIPEWKGYDESRCIVTPREFSITVPAEKNSLTVSEAFDNYIKETYGEDTYNTIINNHWYDYIHRMYSFTTDIDDDKTNYTITFKLK